MTTMVRTPRPIPVKEEVMPQKKSPSIPEELLLEFVGNIPNLFKIDQHHIWNNRYRINVWTQEWAEGRFCPTNRIAKSFYLLYEDGKIFDKTIKKRIDIDDK